MNLLYKVYLILIALVWLALIKVNAQQAEDYDRSTRRPARTRPATRTATTSPQAVETIKVNGTSFKMVYVEGGTFTMGSANDQGNYFKDECPSHEVTLKSYRIGETEVTQQLWQAVMGTNPSYFTGPLHPVEKVSWEDCQAFIKQLNSLTGRNFRLPTEAEWEYAAKGGKKKGGNTYSGGSDINEAAWYCTNSSTHTHDVATTHSNELGLYDMSGNVYEWCQDWYDDNYYSKDIKSNPSGPPSGTRRVVRGGCWHTGARYCTVTYRHSRKPTDRNFSIGLRLALDAKVVTTTNNQSSPASTTHSTICSSCRGKGYTRCSTCHGSGKTNQTGSDYRTCYSCGGRGEIKCSKCGGSGRK